MNVCASIHEQRCYKNDESACKQETNIGGEKAAITVVSVHLEDKEDLLFCQMAKLRELLPEPSDVLVYKLLLLEPFLVEECWLGDVVEQVIFFGSLLGSSMFGI